MKQMKNILLLMAMCVLVGLTVIGCSKKETDSEDSTTSKVASGENQPDDIKETGSAPIDAESENITEAAQTSEDTIVKEIQEAGETDETDEAEEATSVFNSSGVYETAHFSIGEFDITYPISWDDLKEILDTNNVDYTNLATNIERSTIQAGETVFLDDEDNHGNGFIINLKKDGDEITVSSIVVNMAKGLHFDKYPVKFDGKLDIYNEIDDAIELYGEPDLVIDKTPQMVYRWVVSDKRKVQVTIMTGLDESDRTKISQITVGSGK